MNRQYIGARYVVKVYENSQDRLSAEWEQGAFEPLVMVTWQNSSYVSKKQVPGNVGNPADNPQYWACTGYYNGQILQLQNGVSDLQSNVSSLQTNLSNLHANLSNRNRKILFIGDSYNSALHHGGWAEKVATNLGLSNDDYWSFDGAGVGFGTESDNGGFSQMYQNAISSLTDEEKQSITDVVIGGSINDAGRTTAEIKEGLLNVEALVTTHTPNAKYWIFPCGWAYTDSSIRENALNAYNIYNSNSHFAKVINGVWKIFVNPYFLETDMVHPTEQGQINLAQTIATYLNGSNEYMREYSNLNTNFNEVITVDGNITNSGVRVKYNKTGGIPLASPTTITAYPNGVKIAECSGSSNNNLFERDAEFPCTVMYRDSSMNFINGRGVLKVVKEETHAWSLYLSSTSINTGLSSYDVPNVEAVYPAFDVMLDLDKN